MKTRRHTSLYTKCFETKAKIGCVTSEMAMEREFQGAGVVLNAILPKKKGGSFCTVSLLTLYIGND